MGRRLEEGRVRLGIQRAGKGPERSVFAAQKVRGHAGESATSDHERHEADRDSHQLHQHGEAGSRPRARRSRGRGQAGTAQERVQQPGAITAGHHPADGNQGRRRIVQSTGAPPAGQGLRAAARGAFPQSPDLLHVRRRRRAAPEPDLHQAGDRVGRASGVV